VHCVFVKKVPSAAAKCVTGTKTLTSKKCSKHIFVTRRKIQRLRERGKEKRLAKKKKIV